MAYTFHSPNPLLNFQPFHDDDTNPSPQIDRGPGGKPSVMLVDPDQPTFGPVWHRVVNFVDLPDPFKCQGEGCPMCVETDEYTLWLRPEAKLGARR